MAFIFLVFLQRLIGSFCRQNPVWRHTDDDCIFMSPTWDGLGYHFAAKMDCQMDTWSAINIAVGVGFEPKTKLTSVHGE